MSADPPLLAGPRVSAPPRVLSSPGTRGMLTWGDRRVSGLPRPRSRIGQRVRPQGAGQAGGEPAHPAAAHGEGNGRAPAGAPAGTGPGWLSSLVSTWTRAYPPTPLSCSTSARGSRADVINTSPIFSEPAHIFPPCPEEKPQPTRPRHLPARVTHLTRPSPASLASVLGRQFLACPYALDTARETVLAPVGLVFSGEQPTRPAQSHPRACAVSAPWFPGLCSDRAPFRGRPSPPRARPAQRWPGGLSPMPVFSVRCLVRKPPAL